MQFARSILLAVLTLITSGPCIAGGLATQPDEIDLGAVPIASSSPAMVVHLNTSGKDVLIKEIVLIDEASASAQVISDNCSGKHLKPNDGCTAVVVAAPIRPGDFAVLVASHYAVGGVEDVQRTAILGRGYVGEKDTGSVLDMQQAGLDVPDQVDFGDNAGSRAIVATNQTSVPIRISRIDLVGQKEAGMAIVSATCVQERILNPQESCDITISWRAPLDSARRADLLIWHDGPRRIAKIELLTDPVVAGKDKGRGLPLPPMTVKMLNRR